MLLFQLHLNAVGGNSELMKPIFFFSVVGTVILFMLFCFKVQLHASSYLSVIAALCYA